MENYIVINGKKAELTEEQLEKLGIKPEKIQYEKMFDRIYNENYYAVNSQGKLVKFCEFRETGDDRYFNAGNYCRNETIMKQRALHETLNRLLWRASVIAGELDNPWELPTKHYYIYKDYREDIFRVHYNDSDSTGLAYFPSEKAARDAIKNIIEPFTKEHPDFVW